MMRFTILILAVLSAPVLFAQQRTVSGKVVSEEDDIPLPGYNVMEPGTTNGTVTDINGEFTLVIKSDPAIIMVPGCFSHQFVAYEEGVTFKKIALPVDVKRKRDEDSKKAEEKWLRSRPTRNISGYVIDRKTKTPVAGCEVRASGSQDAVLTDEEGVYYLTVPNNQVIEVEIRCGTVVEKVVYQLNEHGKKVKLRDQKRRGK